MKTSSHEELENHNVVMFPSSKNFKIDLSKMEASQDPLYNILNEYSDLSEDDLPDYNDDRFELDFEDELEGDSYHSLEAFMGRNSEEEIHSPDDMLNRNMSSAYFPGTLPLYHTYLTTKSYGVQELLDLGCPQVLFVENAYDPDTHRPLPPASSPIFSCAVGFIGTYEPDRAAILKRLALAGIPVTIRGNLWRPLQWQAIAGLSFLPEVIGDEYSRAICSTRINLAFLRKSNRDLQTTRSIEIPACAGFMLAERTAEHEALFREGVEAEYFAGFDELVQKIKKTLADEPQRKAIALAGRTRCLRDDYTYAGRFRTAFQTLGIPLPGSSLKPSGCAE